MKKTFLAWSGFAGLLALSCYLSGCGPAHEIKAGNAVSTNVAQIEARGRDLENMSVTVTSSTNTTIVLPVATLFISSAGGTQNMMSAETVRFVFTTASPGSPQTITQLVPAYCINRFREVPTSDSEFTVSYSEETNPVRKLAACLEHKAGSKRAKQLAIWMVSDDLLALTPDELEQRFIEETESKVRHDVTGTKLAAVIKEESPETPDEVLDAIKGMSTEELQPYLDRLIAGLRGRSKTQVQEYRDETPRLLRACGYDLSKSRFYQ